MDRYHCEFPEETPTMSAHECTGLMPRPPKTEEEFEAYQALFGMEIPKQ